MSLDITGTAMDSLPVNPQKNQGNNYPSIMGSTGSEPRVENKLIRNNVTEETQNTLELAKKEMQDEEKAMSTPQLEQVAKQLQEFMGQMNRGLEFLVDEDSGRDVIKVLDKTSGELIKQYPSEEVLSLVAKLSEATGNFIDSKV
jgi:flagellar protein FlaG